MNNITLSIDDIQEFVIDNFGRSLTDDELHRLAQSDLLGWLLPVIHEIVG